jgi:hypothetical protein
MFAAFWGYHFESVQSGHQERQKMATIKADLTPELKEQYAQSVAQKLEDGGKLLISITHTSASNMSYRYKVDLAYNANGKTEIEHLTYWLAACWKESIYAGAFNELKGNGVGTDRYFLAAYNIGLTLKGFGLIDDPYEIANRRTYQEI